MERDGWWEGCNKVMTADDKVAGFRLCVHASDTRTACRMMVMIDGEDSMIEWLDDVCLWG